MINFEKLESNSEFYKDEFKSQKPFSYVVIDDLCDNKLLRLALQSIEDSDLSYISKSRDWIFAKNKYESASFDKISPLLLKLKSELLSKRFANFITNIVGDDIIIDPDFHGGGLHQGGSGSFLDMHADFNFHPLKPTWFRNVNILLYLNESWKAEYGGQLKLQDGRKNYSKVYEIEPIFNRLVIMHTREYTLHGYDKISFPKGTFRRSIAVYGYTPQDKAGEVRTTIWHPSDGSILKRILGKHMPKLVRLKTMFLGSRTAGNK